MREIAVPNQNAPDMKQLIDSYGNSLLRMCYLYLHDMQLAEDAVQETYIKVYKNWNTFRGEASEKTWITKIAMNVCNSMRRTQWYRNMFFSYDVPFKEGIYDEEHFCDDTVINAIYQLKPKYREIILLFYYQEMKVKEIADFKGISESAVTVRLTRAREQLKQPLKGWYFNE